jgi:hypothetical protein
MDSYRAVKDGYMELVRLAAYKSGEERKRALDALENQNQRLQNAVLTILEAWKRGNAKLEEYSEDTIDGLREDLEMYKRQLDDFRASRDELTRLQIVYGSSQSDTTAQKYTYYAYIIAVLVLLVIDFILFVVVSFNIGGSAAAAVESVVPEVPMG